MSWSEIKTGKYRDGGPEYGPDGTERYFKNGVFHRVDGPAITYPNGAKSWYQYGHLHRTNGPAVERADGSKEWWLNGEYYEATEWLLKKFELGSE